MSRPKNNEKLAHSKLDNEPEVQTEKKSQVRSDANECMQNEIRKC